MTQASRFSSRVVIIGQVLGALATVTLLSTILTYALTRELGWMIYGKVVFGLFGAGFYFVSNSQALSRFFGSRSTVYTTATVLATAGFLAAIAAINFFGRSVSREYDLTKNQIFSLAEQTEKVLERLDKEVKVIGFYRPEEPERGGVEELVERYAARSKMVVLRFINPDKDPEAVKKYQITQGGQRIVVESQGQTVKLRDGTEEELTNAIVRIAQKAKKKLYFLTGHGEADITSGAAEGFKMAADALTDEGYDIETLTLLDKTRVPEGAAAVIIAAPKTALLKPELEMLNGYLFSGGHVMVMIEPGADGGMTAFLQEWRIIAGNDMVLDTNPMSRAFGFGQEMPIVQKLETHPINHGMKASVVFPTVCSMNGAAGAVAGVKATEVVKTSEGSWGEKNYDVPDQPVKGPEDYAGPVPIMTVSTKAASGSLITKESEQARLLAVGDHDFATNRFLPMLGNKDLFLNAVNWLAEEEDRISIRPRTRGSSQILLTDTQATFIEYFSIDIVPMVLLAIGVAVWQVRRRK